MTDPGKHAHLYGDLPSDIEALVAITQGLVIDKDFVGLYGLALEERERLGEVDIRYVSDIYDQLLAKDGGPLTEPREPNARFIGSCRDYALVLCSMLRHVGVPTRLRFGFATYFSKEPDTYSDHCICEYWDEGQDRWVLVDSNVDPVIKLKLGVTANEFDLERNQFIVASDGWRLARDGKANPDRFGVPSINIQGLWFIRGSLMRDLAALNKVEMLPWDYWGLADRTPIDALPSEELPLLDELARTLAAPHDLAQLQASYAHPEFIVPATVRSFSPLRGETQVVLR
ncbi:MAG: transglutaminase domain-containing protein [Rhodospirillales bacterium]|nr:transglutaminase domain-containing protein [Rhodospirillales bacterium]